MKIRLFLDQDLSNTESLSLSSTLDLKFYHYLTSVLKLDIGESVYFFNQNIEYKFTLQEKTKRQLLFVRVECNSILEELCNISLILPVIKTDKMVQIVKQATELGVKELYPFLSERTQPVNNFNYERLQKNIIEALEQTDGMLLPKLHNPQKLYDITANIKGHIACGITKNNNTLDISNKINQHFTSVACLIGPEGGFSDNEISTLSNLNNIYFINLGKRIMRTETASVALITAAKMKMECFSDTQG